MVKILESDWMVIVAIGLFFTAHLTTIFIAGFTADIVGDAEKSEAAFRLSEGNPLVSFMIYSMQLSGVVTLILLPAFVGGLYYYARRKLVNTEPIILSALAVVIFLASLIDASNDVAYAAGLILKYS